MAKEIDYECFLEDGYVITGTFQQGNSKNVSKHVIRGKSIRVLSSPYKIMLSTSTASFDGDRIAQELGQFSRNAIFVDNNQNIVETCELESETRGYLQELSMIVAPLNLSFEIRNSHRMVYNTITGKVTFGHESYAFWVMENSHSDVVKRTMLGSFSTLALPPQSLLIQEKEHLLTPIKKATAGRKYNLLFLRGSSCLVFHEILGHYFEVSNEHNSCPSPSERISSYQLNAYNATTKYIQAPTFDDEGVAIKQTALIRNGECVNLLTDTRSSGVNSNLTGNCRRSSFYYYPEPRMRNIIVMNNHDCIENLLDESLPTLVVKKAYQGLYNRKEGRVTLYVFADSCIQSECNSCQKMILEIDDTISNFYNGISATFGSTYHISLYCKSFSGPLYTEATSPELYLRNINIKRIWLL